MARALRVVKVDKGAALDRGICLLRALVRTEQKELDALRRLLLAARAVQRSPRLMRDPEIRSALDCGYETLLRHHSAEAVTPYAHRIGRLNDRAAIEFGLVTGREVMLSDGEAIPVEMLRRGISRE
jgi:hypothetical protein